MLIIQNKFIVNLINLNSIACSDGSYKACDCEDGLDIILADVTL